MIPNTKDREVESHGVTASTSFGISQKDSAHIMSILREQIYSDKVLAVLREYGSNAWDAHRDAGKRDLPIKVTLPTISDSTLTIRDFGKGLSKEAVFEVYTQYGASTKRDSDDAVGMLGIGSKSGFAYSDSFTVTSCNGGMRRTYVAVLDETDKGTINLLHEAPCGDETGVEIQIPVRPEDIQEFESKAKILFEYFEPRPDINTSLPPKPSKQTALQHGTIFDKVGRDQNYYGYGSMQQQGWVAVMGCVPYRINLQQLQGDSLPEGGIPDYINRVSGALYFNIGEVQISASREELKYSAHTKKTLVRKFNLLVEEFVKHTLAEVEKGAFTMWEKRVRAQILGHMRLPIPKEFQEVVQPYVKIDPEPVKFSITRNRVAIGTISIAHDARILIRDELKDLEGYSFQYHDYLVRPNPGVPLDEINEEINDLTKKWGVDGIPVLNLSAALSWTPPYKKQSNKQVNKKHQVSTFRLKQDGRFYNPWSQAWDIEDRVPTEDDVFVIISGFKTEGYSVYEYLGEDKKLAKIFNASLPEIYGYKTMEHKPLRPDKLKGTHYPIWRVDFARSLLSNEVKQMFYQTEWANAFEHGYTENRVPLTKMEGLLGPSHFITVAVRKQFEGHRESRKIAQETREGLHILGERLNKTQDKSEAARTMAAIYERYPLLKIHGHNISMLWGGNSDRWVEYVKTLDRTTQRSDQCKHLRTLSRTSRSRSSGTESPGRSRSGLRTSRG